LERPPASQSVGTPGTNNKFKNPDTGSRISSKRIKGLKMNYAAKQIVVKSVKEWYI